MSALHAGIPKLPCVCEFDVRSYVDNVEAVEQGRRTRAGLTVLFVHACSKYQKRAEAQMAAKGGKLLFIIVDLSPVTDIDASAVHFLMVLVNSLMCVRACVCARVCTS